MPSSGLWTPAGLAPFLSGGGHLPSQQNPVSITKDNATLSIAIPMATSRPRHPTLCPQLPHGPQSCCWPPTPQNQLSGRGLKGLPRTRPRTSSFLLLATFRVAAGTSDQPLLLLPPSALEPWTHPRFPPCAWTMRLLGQSHIPLPGPWMLMSLRLHGPGTAFSPKTPSLGAGLGVCLHMPPAPRQRPQQAAGPDSPLGFRPQLQMPICLRGASDSLSPNSHS